MNLELMFTTFPIIETERLVLRKVDLTDAEAMFEYFSKECVIRYYDLEKFEELDEANQLITTFHRRYEDHVAIRWGITLKENDQLIGTCGFHQIEAEHAKVELGYELHPLYWRQGMMSEAISAIIKYAFEEVEINRIEAFIDSENSPSEQLLKKCGFQQEGVLRERFFEKGKYIDAIIAGYLKTDYENKFSNIYK